MEKTRKQGPKSVSCKTLIVTTLVCDDESYLVNYAKMTYPRACLWPLSSDANPSDSPSPFLSSLPEPERSGENGTVIVGTQKRGISEDKFFTLLLSGEISAIAGIYADKDFGEYFSMFPHTPGDERLMDVGVYFTFNKIVILGRSCRAENWELWESDAREESKVKYQQKLDSLRKLSTEFFHLTTINFMNTRNRYNDLMICFKT